MVSIAKPVTAPQVQHPEVISTYIQGVGTVASYKFVLEQTIFEHFYHDARIEAEHYVGPLPILGNFDYLMIVAAHQSNLAYVKWCETGDINFAAAYIGYTQWTPSQGDLSQYAPFAKVWA